MFPLVHSACILLYISSIPTWNQLLPKHIHTFTEHTSKLTQSIHFNAESVCVWCEVWVIWGERDRMLQTPVVIVKLSVVCVSVSIRFAIVIGMHGIRNSKRLSSKEREKQKEREYVCVEFEMSNVLNWGNKVFSLYFHLLCFPLSDSLCARDEKLGKAWSEMESSQRMLLSFVLNVAHSSSALSTENYYRGSHVILFACENTQIHQFIHKQNRRIITTSLNHFPIPFLLYKHRVIPNVQSQNEKGPCT